MKKTIQYLFTFMIFSMMLGQGVAQEEYPVSLQVGDTVTYKNYFYDSTLPEEIRESTSWDVNEIISIQYQENSTLVRSKTYDFSEKPANDTNTYSTSSHFLIFANISETVYFGFPKLIPSNMILQDYSLEIEEIYARYSDMVDITYFDGNYGVEINIDIEGEGKSQIIARYTSTGVLIHFLSESSFSLNGISQKSVREQTLENELSDFDGCEEESSSVKSIPSIPAYSEIPLSMFSLIGISIGISRLKTKHH